MMTNKIEQIVSKSDIGDNFNRSILICHTEQTHEDFEFVLAGLSAKNVKTYIFNIQPLLYGSLDFADFINRFDWKKIDVIDIRYCRGIPRRWEKGYKNIFRELKQFLDLQKSQGNAISITPSFETLNWVLDKASYIKELQQKGIPTVHTIIVSHWQLSEFDIADYLNQDGVEKIVLKPAIGSGADGLEFIIRVKNEAHRYEVKTYSREPDDQVTQKLIKLKNNQQLYNYFQNSCRCFNVSKLVQKFEKLKREISAVFVGNTPHFIERTIDVNTEIAHEKFGGENIFILNPPEAWQTFAQDVYQVLLDSVKKTVSIRIDIFELVDGKLILNEVEGASHRVLFPETLQYYKQDILAEKQEISQLKLETMSPLKNYIEMLCNLH
ncbi:hypothetical protein H6G74_01940 [Nostoc spongiaeforme FACHB-130]|uniref:ATP-grasp domain-containing protein n=1 Tax=Nostoc spongiaeforme FACHB-130 TaxID=1357510 RepID=A0ABR8FP45_9NOSO|nr:hypothetical protein [Nostoc spongiaeforme]MBD2593091.1 hypothetical protein [Nostoc spongiaeforme FACHB-130]